MTSNFRSYLPRVAASIAIVPVSMGLYGALDPGSAMETAFGWKSPTDPSNRQLVHSVMQLYSFRSIGFGLSTIALWYTGNHKAIGYTMLTGLVVAFGDGLTCYRHSGDIADGMKHWFFIPISLAIGTGILGWI